MTELIKKLRLPIGGRILIVNPPPGYIEALGDAGEGAESRLGSAGNGEYDFVQLFIKDRAELDQLGPTAFAKVKFDGLLWVCYPKGSSGVKTDINRDSLWKLIEPTGMRPVTQISIDSVWSALRFRPAQVVGK